MICMSKFAILGILLLPVLVDAQPSQKTKAKSASRDAVSVKGPTRLKVELIEGKVDVVRGKNTKIEVVMKNASGTAIAIAIDGDTARVLVDGDSEIESADLEIRVPANSPVDIECISADVTVSGVAGDVEIEAVSGEVQVAGARNVDIEVVSGDILATGIVGGASLASVSGDIELRAPKGKATRIEMETVSGDLEYAGVCAAKCRMEIESLSGDVHLKLDKKHSAFEIEFESFSGRLKDGLGLKETSHRGRRGRGSSDVGHFGSKTSYGEIECATHSGDLRLSSM